MSKSQWLWAVVMTIILIWLGGAREIIFININEQIAYNDGLIDTYRVLDAFAFLKDHPTRNLKILKWILTLAFAILYLLLSYVTFRQIIKDKQGAKWILICYGCGLLIAGLLYIGGGLLNDQTTGYTLSRVVMGALQSPFPLMLMIPARMLAVR